MLNWGDKDASERLAGQLKELLRDRTMTFDQLASVYSIKNGQSVAQRLKDMSRNGRALPLGDFVAQMPDFFEPTGKNQVRARLGPGAPVVTTMVAGGYPSAASSAAGAAIQSATAAARATVEPATVAQDVAISHTVQQTWFHMYGEDDGSPAAFTPPVVMKYADVSRGVQNILKEQHEPIAVDELDCVFRQRFGLPISDIVGMSTGEYLTRKDNIFDYDATRGTVFLQSAVLPGPPMADPAAIKDEGFVVREFEQLIEAMGPVVYISTICGKFIQRNGISVSSVISTRPLDLFKRHPGVFLIVGQGNVTLKKYERLPDVQRLVDKPSSKAHRIVKAAEEAQLPLPGVITEQHVVEEFRRLILADGTDSVYISSLCGRFLQRFKKPVTSIISCKPAEFLRRYPEIFVMTGGGNAGLREVLGPDAVSVPPPPPRVPKAAREDHALTSEVVQQIELTDQVYYDIHAHLNKDINHQAVVQRLMAVCRQIEQSCFLALEEVVLGGAAGKGLLTTGPAAEIVLFVKQLPYRSFPQWLPNILETMAPVLEHQLASMGAERFKVEKDHLRFFLVGGGAVASGGLAGDLVQVFLCPVFRGREHLLECIKASPPAEQPYFRPALVKERNDFVARQPQRLKVLMRLMAWWASKQCWSGRPTAPMDWLVELVVIHVCSELRRASPHGQEEGLAEAVGRILEVFANFETIKVLWEHDTQVAYSPQDVSRPLLNQEPLFVDPLNPYSNLADASALDSRELAAAAQPPACFIAFQREAAKWLLRSVMEDGEGEDYEGEEEFQADDTREEDDDGSMYEDALEG